MFEIRTGVVRRLATNKPGGYDTNYKWSSRKAKERAYSSSSSCVSAMNQEYQERVGGSGNPMVVYIPTARKLPTVAENLDCGSVYWEWGA